PGVVGLLPNDPGAITADHARRVRELGFTGASVMLAHPTEVSPQALDNARDVLADHGIRVAQSNASYPVLVHPNEATRAEGIRQAQAACRSAARLRAVYQLIRPGSLSPAGAWRPHRDNHTRETQDRLVSSLRAVCDVAEGEGVTIGLECHVISPLDSPRRVREVIDAVGSPALKYNADAVNFVGSFADAYDTPRVLQEIFSVLGGHVVSAHVKDVCLGDRLVVHIDECAPGEGIFDLVTFMRLYERHSPTGYALIEHLPDAKIPAAKEALDRVLETAGITWRMD
ncbi:MAG TPA: sugar phosphate isomerase/epimerase family protein, partial [Chloroflexota bacterium]|nr:sugar phosphate isomerase/epimerase family protein [Chloroflexota bacterium]